MFRNLTAVLTACLSPLGTPGVGWASLASGVLGSSGCPPLASPGALLPRRTCPGRLSYQLHLHLPLETCPQWETRAKTAPKVFLFLEPSSSPLPKRSLPGIHGGSLRLTDTQLKQGPLDTAFPSVHLCFSEQIGVGTGERLGAVGSS